MEANEETIFSAFDHIGFLVKKGKKITDQDIDLISGSLLDLGDIFALSNFELFIIIMCLGVELDNELREYLTGNKEPFFVTVDRICSMYETPNWQAFTHNSALFEYELVTRNHLDMPFPANTLRASEWCINYAMGEITLPRILDDIRTVTISQAITLHQAKQVQAIVKSWEAGVVNHNQSTLVLECRDINAAREIAAYCADTMDLLPYELSSLLLPQQLEQLEHFTKMWSRHYLCCAGLLIVNLNNLNREQHLAVYTAVEQMIAKGNFLFIVIGADTVLQNASNIFSHKIVPPSYDDKLALIASLLQEQTPATQEYLKEIAWRFPINTALIDKIHTALNLNEPHDEEMLKQAIYALCSDELKADFKGLADYIETNKTWDDLIVPKHVEQELHAIADHIKHQKTIYHDWGFGEKQNQVGVCALFSGSSGTGKTTAAAILAKELKLSLVRVNLSAVVSKYIGETEKNLSIIFDAAEKSNVLLLFDEADALFGKRSEVRDSRDRYANMEVSYLLQRIESYSGLAVLTTNIKESFDKAFTRRFRFMIDFPFPMQQQREDMWKKMIPRKMPHIDLDYRKLALINVTGGIIYNIILRAAHIAANQNQPLTMSMIAEATRFEFSKDNRQIPETILQTWINNGTPLLMPNKHSLHAQEAHSGT